MCTLTRLIWPGVAMSGSPEGPSIAMSGLSQKTMLGSGRIPVSPGECATQQLDLEARFALVPVLARSIRIEVVVVAVVAGAVIEARAPRRMVDVARGRASDGSDARAAVH